MDYLTVLWAFLLMLGLGAVLGLLLALAAKFFHVEEDPRIKEVEDMDFSIGWSKDNFNPAIALFYSIISEIAKPRA